MMLLSLSHSSLTQPPAHPDTISLITITHSFTYTSPVQSHDVTLSHTHHSPSHLLTQTLSHLSLSPTHLPTHHPFNRMMLLSLTHSSLTQPPAHPDTISLITITHSITHTSPVHSHDVTLSLTLTTHPATCSPTHYLTYHYHSLIYPHITRSLS